MKRIALIGMLVVFVFGLSGCGGQIGESFTACIESDCEDADLEVALDEFVVELEEENDITISLEGYEKDLVISEGKDGLSILLHYVRTDLTYEDGFNVVDELYSIHTMIEEGLADLELDVPVSLISRVYLTEGTSLHYFSFELNPTTPKKRMKISLDQTDATYTQFFTSAFDYYKEMLVYSADGYEVYMEVDTDLVGVELSLPKDGTEINFHYENDDEQHLNEVLALLQDAINEDYTILVE